MNEKKTELLPLETRVVHIGGQPGTHGAGTIVAYNQAKANNYFEKGLNLAKDMAEPAPVLQGLLTGLYDGNRCPYVVRWDNGYTDVYEPTSIEVFNPTPEELDVFNAKWQINLAERRAEEDAMLESHAHTL